jgi:hypothetical protein
MNYCTTSCKSRSVFATSDTTLALATCRLTKLTEKQRKQGSKTEEFSDTVIVIIFQF